MDKFYSTICVCYQITASMYWIYEIQQILFIVIWAENSLILQNKVLLQFKDMLLISTGAGLG